MNIIKELETQKGRDKIKRKRSKMNFIEEIKGKFERETCLVRRKRK